VFVPHTHWDREWYEPFQVFRFRLVEVLDEVLELAERESDFRFTLDGQAAAIVDYLAIRPENAGRVRALVAQGRLAIGPWYILLDEFLCSGETIVRNLQLGASVSKEFGGAMTIGYLPDMFGHIAQMPQILSKAGLLHTALWRGVPGRVKGHAFRWRAPDGSSVRAEYLFDGYSNAMELFLLPGQVREAVAEYASESAPRWGSDPMLGMVGTDHMAPNPGLLEWVRAVDEPQFPARLATLEEYIDLMPSSEALMVIEGELRSHVRGNILPGVLSVRRELKVAMSASERLLFDAERLAASHSKRDFSPFLDSAWRKVIESSAHDSVVGSGTDETVMQVAARLAEAGQIARAVRDAVIAEIAASVPTSTFAVINTLPFARIALAEAVVEASAELRRFSSADGTALRTQVLDQTDSVLADESFSASDLHRVANRIHRTELFGYEIESYTIEPGTLTFRLSSIARPGVFDLFGFRAELLQAADSHRGPWRVLTLAEPRQRLLVELPIAGLSVVPVSPHPPEATSDVDSLSNVVTTTAAGISNGHVSAIPDAHGCLTITGSDGTVLSGVGRIVDGGDRGDSYNYGPPMHDRLIGEPISVDVEVLEKGPLRGQLRVRRTYRWPADLDLNADGRGVELVDVVVNMVVELRSHEDFVRLNVDFLNHSRGHRVRLHVPLGELASGSESAGQFAVTARGRESEGGWGEYPLPTYPAESFVCAGPATVLLEHTSEYEVVDSVDPRESELAITLLRAVGSISVNVHPLREEPAYAEVPIPGAQEIGSTVIFRAAILPCRAGWQAAGAVERAALFRSDVLTSRGTAVGPGARQFTPGFEVSGRDVEVSSLRRVGGGVELRLIAMSPSPTRARVRGPFRFASPTDLLGRRGIPVDATSGLEIELSPWEISSWLLQS